MVGLGTCIRGTGWMLCTHWLRSVRTVLIGLALLLFGIAAIPNQLFAFQVSPRSDSAETIRRQILRQTIFGNRKHKVQLGRAKQQLESGHTAEALAHLQSILLLESDSATLGGESGTTLVSIRGEVMRLLGDLPLQTLQTYQQVYGDAAQRQLDEARERGDPALFARVVRQYFHTEAGFHAVDWLACRWLDRGQYSLAAATWDRILSERTHRRRLRPKTVLKAALAYRLAGKREAADRLLQRFNLWTVKVAGRQIPPETVLAEVDNLRDTDQDRTEWVQAQGNARRNASSAGSIPFLMPRWSVSLAGKGRELAVASNWEKSNSNNSEMLSAVANYPIVVGNQVILRNFSGIRAIEIHTGKPIWNYPNEVNVRELLNTHGHSNSPRDAAILNAFVGNATSGMLASDGRRVFSIEFLKPDAVNPDASGQAKKASIKFIGRKPVSRNRPQDIQIANRLVAVMIPNPDSKTEITVRPVWSVGGPAKRTGPNDWLAGHYLLGAPVYAHGVLYVITEYERQVNLAALNPATGRAMWVQGIALVPSSIRDADQRSRFAATCSPSAADGVVVCPTGCGVLVGVDGLTGTLLWAYDYRDYEDRRFRTMSTRNAQLAMRPRGHVGFASLPVIERDVVVFLPRHSKQLHCVRLRTGKPAWKEPEPCMDAEYVGAIVDDTVLVVGNPKVRGLSLETGEEIWAEYMGPPSGRGIRIGRKFLLPLKSKPVACFDIETGKRSNVELRESATSRWSDVVRADRPEFDLIRPVADLPQPELQQFYLQPGNLVASADVIVSAGPQYVTTFPQAEFLLSQLDESRSETPQSAESQLLVAELHLTTGDLTSAEKRLNSLNERQLSQRQSTDARSLMLELQYSKLKSQFGDQDQVLAAIDRLSTTRDERGRFLVHKSERQLTRGDFEGLLQSIQEFRSLDLQSELSVADDPQHSIAAMSWVPDMIGRIQSRFDADAVDRVRTHIDNEQTAALQANNVAHLKSFLGVYSEWPQADAVRVELARRYIELREFQKAELLLLQNRNSPNIQTAGIATASLARMWDELGLSLESAKLLEELDSRYADTLVADNQVGRQFVKTLASDGATLKLFRSLRAPDWPVSRVRISEHRWLENNPYLLESYGRYRRRFQTPRGLGFHLLDKGTTRESQIAVIRKDSGTVVGNINVPARHSYPKWAKTSLVGHLIPMGSPATMHGVSLLEHDDEKPFWEWEFQQVKFSKEFLRVGPAGPSFCTFQTRQHLVAVNPADGRLFWRRSDIEPGSGLVGDQTSGLIGDNHVLVLFAKDRANYTVYQTRTGKILRHGRLDIDPQYLRRVFGRKLFYVTQSTTDRRMRVWDPLHDRFEFDEPYTKPLLTAVTDEGELAVIVGKDRLKIIDVAKAETKLNLKLTQRQATSLSYVRIFSDAGSYYLNLQRPSPLRSRRLYSYYVSDTFLVATHIQGEIHSVDRHTGEVRWNRTFPQRTFLDLSDYHLPFLIAMSRVRDTSFGNRQSIMIEVIDAQTGQPISSKDNILPDRIVNIEYDREAGRIELFGMKSRISLEFGRKVQRLTGDVPTL